MYMYVYLHYVAFVCVYICVYTYVHVLYVCVCCACNSLGGCRAVVSGSWWHGWSWHISWFFGFPEFVYIGSEWSFFGGILVCDVWFSVKVYQENVPFPMQLKLEDVLKSLLLYSIQKNGVSNIYIPFPPIHASFFCVSVRGMQDEFDDPIIPSFDDYACGREYGCHNGVFEVIQNIYNKSIDTLRVYARVVSRMQVLIMDSCWVFQHSFASFSNYRFQKCGNRIQSDFRCMWFVWILWISSLKLPFLVHMFFFLFRPVETSRYPRMWPRSSFFAIYGTTSEADRIIVQVERELIGTGKTVVHFSCVMARHAHQSRTITLG